jgi:hypothetical protein
MKTLLAFGLLLGAGCCAAAPPSSHPLGSGAAVGVSARPLGGVASPARTGVAGRSAGSRRYGTGYVGPVYYVPYAFGSYTDPSYYGYSSDAGAGYNAAPAAPQPPVIINQYFGAPGPAAPLDAANVDPGVAQAADNPGDPLAPPASYYLIAYKDKSIFSAMAYWVEGDTLHYVTTQNTHNQASLSLIDLEQTYKLNSDRSVPFTIPGK